MIEILKASAGSGKTFNLARKYIAQLFVENVSLPREQWRPNPDPTAYRHVLAVTFTNKATEEMKSRILDELHVLSTEPEKSDHFRFFLEHPFDGNREELPKMAGDALRGILHDYGAFAVSTIDRFFQLALKSFSKEIGHFASYQVELDKPSLVSESVDRVLDSLSPDESSGKLLDWLTDNAITQIQDGGKYSLESALLGVAMRQMTEEHRYKIEKYSIDEDGLYTEERIKKLKDACSGVISGYAADLKKAAAAVRSCLRNAGIDPADTTRSFLDKALLKIEAHRCGDDVPALPALIRQDSDQWFPKKNARLASRVDAALLSSVGSLVALYDGRLKEYNTALLLRGQVYGLGVAACLRKAFDDLVKEKNVLDLDNCNTLLKGIIDGTDAPFIYEKMGVRYEHFLLDEFQDTSRVQWENFLPLLMNSISQGFYNLVVGDVKQSIYRWRNSDWNMLDSELEETFADKCAKDSLDVNYRSLGNIVSFNNDFFKFAAEKLDLLTGTQAVSRIYSEVGQKVKAGKEGLGSVELCFCEADEEPQKVLDAIRAAAEDGFAPGDVGVLVRTNSDGAAIANFLIDNGVEVVTDDSLKISSSRTVRRIVALLSHIDRPDDKMAEYLAAELDVELPKSSLSLLDQCESIARSLRDSDPDTFDSETAYVSGFMDIVREFSEKDSGGLHAFLEAWEDNKASISSPALSDAVRVITVHKAKGLAYPFVIVPYVESIGIYKFGQVWCRPELGGTSLGDDCDGLYDVCLSGKSEDTLFSGDYREESKMQAVDNINVAYVAFTRARERMLLIGQRPNASRRDKLASGAPFGNFAEILHAYAGCQDEVMFGEHVRHEVKNGSKATAMSSGYPSWPLGGRLSLRVDAKDFFSPDGLVGTSASKRLRGIVLHDILSGIVVPSDLQDAVNAALIGGELSGEDAGETMKLLSDALRSGAARGWFPEDRSAVLNETDILDTDGEMLRPDRVLLSPDGGVTVIDYKFGSHRGEYVHQVRRYAKLFARMGRRVDGAFLWYVEKDEAVDCLNLD